MTHKYDLESLVETFKKHATEYELLNEGSFNLAKALAAICEEILKLKVNND